MIIIHSSDDIYGADRLVMHILESLRSGNSGMPLEVWLPADVSRHPHGVSASLRREGSTLQVVHRPFVVLRRSYLSLRGLFPLGLRVLRSAAFLGFRRDRPPVYLTTSALLPLAPIARLLGYRHVYAHVQELWGPGERRVLGFLLRFATSVACISEPVRDSLDNRNVNRARVILNGVQDRGSVVPMGDHKTTFLVASRWNRWKGHRTLLRAAEGLGADRNLVIAGAPPESGEAFDVMGAVDSHPRREDIHVAGEVEDLAPLLENAHLIVVPSDSPEPFGLVAIEAFRAGRPVIASNAGGLAEIVTHGHDGWLFRPGDSDELRTLLNCLTREEISEAGAHARQTFEARFSAERFEKEIRQWLTGR